MIFTIYKRLLIFFIAFLLTLNFFTFLTSGSPKALINPFHVKNRTISMYHLTKHIVLVAGLGFITSSEEDVKKLVQVSCNKYGADPKLIHIMIDVESKRKQFAISRTGAMGLMQVMPTTFFDISTGDPFLAKDNIDAGVKYFARQLKRFKKVELALAAYNAGPQRIKDGKVPEFGETIHYIKRILSAYNNTE
ncbi:MAG: lytic transglycosylase domain-containing protein [Denitrovibrio sp.]|nr:MAG: lytic transglycosylase domain-containing protein [Denitrovibrio sp.]